VKTVGTLNSNRFRLHRKLRMHISYQDVRPESNSYVLSRACIWTYSKDFQFL